MRHRKLSWLVAPLGVLVMAAVFLSTGQAAPLQPNHSAPSIPRQTPSGEAGMQATAAISGIVAAEGSGARLGGIEVCTADESGRCATTAGDGTYTLGGLMAGFDYNFVFQDPTGAYAHEYYDDKPDLSLADRRITAIGGSTIPNINALLSPAGHIAGVVTAENSGVPLSHTQVCAMCVNYSWSECATTGDNGTYDVGGLNTGDYWVKFQNLDYLSETYNDKPDYSAADPVAVTRGSTTSGINAALAAAGRIAGTVTDDKGAPLPNVTVAAYRPSGGDWLDSAWAQTDAAGHYELVGLPPGVYRVWFSVLSGNPSEYYDNVHDILSAADINVAAGSTVAGIDAVLAEQFKIVAIHQPRFAKPGQPITVAVTIKPDAGRSQLRFGLAMPGDWSVVGDSTYSGGQNGSLVYDAAWFNEVSNLDHLGSHWWAGVGTTETWNGAPITLTLNLHTGATYGDQQMVYLLDVPALPWKYWYTKKAPISLTAQQPVHGQAVASVRDVSSAGIGPSASLQRARVMGAQVVYHFLGWDTVETRRDEYNWAILDDVLKQTRAYRQKVILRIYNPPAWRMAHGAPANSPPANSDDLKVFMSRLTVHVKEDGYQDQVAGYVTWNEPNIRQQWGGQAPSAAAYAALLQAAYEGAKAGDPAAVVVSAPLAPTGDQPGVAVDDLTYLGQLYDLGLANYADVIGMNGLGFQNAPGQDTGRPAYNFMRLKYLHDVMAAKGDAGRAVWALEVGWLRQSSYAMGSFEPYKVSAMQQAHYLQGAFKKAADEWPWLKLMVVWNLDFNRYYPPTSTFHWYSSDDNPLAQVLLSDTDPPTYDATFTPSGGAWSPLPAFTLTVPSGSLTGTTAFELTTYPGQGQVLPVGLGFTTVGFNFTLTAGAPDGPVAHFSPPLQLSLTIPDDVSDPGLAKLYTYREEAGWVDVCAEQGSRCQLAGRRLHAGLSHFGDFVMAVPGGYGDVHLPVSLKKH